VTDRLLTIGQVRSDPREHHITDVQVGRKGKSRVKVYEERGFEGLKKELLKK